jgi:hypothetical protein
MKRADESSAADAPPNVKLAERKSRRFYSKRFGENFKATLPQIGKKASFSCGFWPFLA